MSRSNDCGNASHEIDSHGASPSEADEVPPEFVSFKLCMLQEDRLDIVGGTYRETCELPNWNRKFGSGGRAAVAICKLEKITLHTFTAQPDSPVWTEIAQSGIEVRLHKSSSDFAFAYFHPLSRPHIEPPITSVAQNGPIAVSGETVLRFGMLEGEAIIEANRAIYDPQTSRSPSNFWHNGSKAKELALVINESELRAYSGVHDISTGADLLIRRREAHVIVVKAGAHGATVFSNGTARHVPAYRTNTVFKIGSGDVFSATFAHCWGTMKMSPDSAADIASQRTAEYCNTCELPLAPDSINKLRPIRGQLNAPILILGRANTVGQRYVLEEARFRLQELGARIICPSLEPNSSLTEAFGAVLIIDDKLTAHKNLPIPNCVAPAPVVVLDESGENDLSLMTKKYRAELATNDFTSALYNVIWAATAETC